MSISIKSIPVEKIQEAIAAALSELTDGPCKVNVSDLKFETPITGPLHGAESLTLVTKIELGPDKTNAAF